MTDENLLSEQKDEDGDEKISRDEDKDEKVSTNHLDIKQPY